MLSVYEKVGFEVKGAYKTYNKAYLLSQEIENSFSIRQCQYVLTTSLE